MSKTKVIEGIRYHSLEDLMIMLDVCRNTLMKLIRKNEFPCCKICGVYYIPKKSFEQWLNPSND